MRILLAAMLFVFMAVPAHAEFKGPGTTTPVTEASQVAKASDDTPCVLKGNIVEKVANSDDKYIFRDNSGEIKVEIDHKVFAGRTVTPDMEVILKGKVDTKTMKPNEVDVKVLEIVTK